MENLEIRMSCQPTETPASDSFDVATLRERYKFERDRRIMKDGTRQFRRTEGGDYADIYEEDPHTPLIERAPLSEDLEVAILGGGWTGVLAAYHLKQAGITDFRNIDHAGGWGGVWYWNRYPGLQCDNDAYCYLPLLEETGFMPSRQFADGFEILDYINTIVDKFGLGEKALFHTLAQAIRWDETISRWRITTNREDDIRARHVILANGLLNVPKLPGVEGIETFKGKIFHTSRWDYAYTGGAHRLPELNKLADKRVAIVGTGATAIQAIPYLGRYAKHLYVVQRTPSTVDARVNPETDKAWFQSQDAGWQRARQENFQRGAIFGLLKEEPDQICDIWTEINRNLSAELAELGWPDMSIEEFMQRRETIDYRVMERLRDRVDSIVEDKETAEALKPWYRFMCKRPASNNDFYPTFNRPNVSLIDVSQSRGIERLTETGFVANGKEHEIDCIIFASGFEVTSGLERRWGLDAIDGRDGLSLYKHWKDGYRTLHGMTTHGFPNLYFTGFIQSAFNATTTEMVGQHGKHIAYIIKEAVERGLIAVEPSEEAQNAWVDHVSATSVDSSSFIRECTPSYFNGEGEEKGQFYLGDSYGPGWYAFEELISAWREEGKLAGMELG